MRPQIHAELVAIRARLVNSSVHKSGL